MKKNSKKARNQPIKSKVAIMLATAMAVTLLLPVHAVAAEDDASTPAPIIEVDSGGGGTTDTGSSSDSGNGSSSTNTGNSSNAGNTTSTGSGDNSGATSGGTNTGNSGSTTESGTGGNTGDTSGGNPSTNPSDDGSNPGTGGDTGNTDPDNPGGNPDPSNPGGTTEPGSGGNTGTTDPDNPGGNPDPSNPGGTTEPGSGGNTGTTDPDNPGGNPDPSNPGGTTEPSDPGSDKPSGVVVPNQPGTSKGIDVKYDITLEDGVFKLKFDVTDEVTESNIVLNLSETLKVLDLYYQQYLKDRYGIDDPNAHYKCVPTDSNPFDIEVTISNGHTYRYKDGSFRMETANTSEMDGLTNFVGFDSQQIPLGLTGAMSKSQPMQDLYGVRATKITANMVADTYTYLADKGYTGKDALTNYLLDYYNNMYSYEYQSLNDLYDEHPDVIMSLFGGMADDQFYVNAEQLEELKATSADNIYICEEKNGQYIIQFKWPESQLVEVSYQMFYENLLNFAFGDKETQQNFLNNYDAKWYPYTFGVKNYMDNASDAWANVNKYLNEATKAGLSKKDATKFALSMAMGIDGPWTNNSYQCYEFAWYNAIELEQIDGDLTINKVDKDGNLITNPATFNLYYYKLEANVEVPSMSPDKLLSTNSTDSSQDTGMISNNDDYVKVTYYYAIGKDGNGYFTTDQSKAAALVTENGSVNVKYLIPDAGEYYIKEISAPDGYKLSSDEIAITLTSGETAVFNVQNDKNSGGGGHHHHPDPEPKPDPDPVPKPDPDPDPVPVPDPDPVPNPEPTPEPEPTPDPEPTPEPQPTKPDLEPQPTKPEVVKISTPKKEVKKTITNTPKTGDHSNLTTCAMIGGISLVVGFTMALTKRKDENT